jgi:hypothetical protein
LPGRTIFLTPQPLLPQPVFIFDDVHPQTLVE